MGPLLLALGCTAKPPGDADPDGPDTTTTTTPGIDLTGDTAFVPPEVPYFQPFNLYAVGYLGWDEQTATAGSYLWTTGAVIPPQIAITLYTADFLIDGDYEKGACGFVLVYDTAFGPLLPETWTFTRDGTDHTHLGLRFPAGTFTLGDVVDLDRGMLGCSRHEFDPARFPIGLFGEARARDWGVGFGTRDPGLEPGSDSTGALLDDDLLVGGSMLTRADPPYDARWFTRGYALDDEGVVLPEVLLRADEMLPASSARSAETGIGTETGVDPPGLPRTGAYLVFPPDWVLFSSIW